MRRALQRQMEAAVVVMRQNVGRGAQQGLQVRQHADLVHVGLRMHLRVLRDEKRQNYAPLRLDFGQNWVHRIADGIRDLPVIVVEVFQVVARAADLRAEAIDEAVQHLRADEASEGGSVLTVVEKRAKHLRRLVQHDRHAHSAQLDVADGHPGGHGAELHHGGEQGAHEAWLRHCVHELLREQHQATRGHHQHVANHGAADGMTPPRAPPARLKSRFLERVFPRFVKSVSNFRNH
eukprot:scaffold1941_cov263-Pinguiococcus_pyrenoidosus.AAC.18